MRIIGDIHGDMKFYTYAIQDTKESIQVGDFNIGFYGDHWHDKVNELHANGEHKFIRGNHDNPAKCKDMSGYIADGCIRTYGNTKVMFVGGAWSIDRARRVEGVDWWNDEQCSYGQFQMFIDIYAQEKPDVMITHDAPIYVTDEMFIRTGLSLGGTSAKQTANITNTALQFMFDAHQPKLWCFGHWHITMASKVGDTMFQCVGANDWIDVDLEDYSG